MPTFISDIPFIRLVPSGTNIDQDILKNVTSGQKALNTLVMQTIRLVNPSWNALVSRLTG